MGRKRNRTWKCFCLSIAYMIFLAFTGCATLKEMEAKRETFKEMEAKRETREYLIKARELLEEGDYEGFLRENQKVLSLYENVPPGDEALFNAGLLYAHYGFLERDYQQSLDLFKRLVKVFPQGPFAVQARIWIGILQENTRLNKLTEDLDKSLKKLRQDNEKLKKEIEELNIGIKKSKQVDIEIDEKKKELSK